MPQAAMTTEVKKKAMPSIKHDDNGQLEGMPNYWQWEIYNSIKKQHPSQI